MEIESDSKEKKSPKQANPIEKAPEEEEEEFVKIASGITGDIHVNIISAEGLQACDNDGKSDPYVILEINGKEVFRTRYILSIFFLSFFFFF